MTASRGKTTDSRNRLIPNDAIQLPGSGTAHILSNHVEQLDFQRPLGILNSNDVAHLHFGRCLCCLFVEKDRSDITRLLPLRSARDEKQAFEREIYAQRIGRPGLQPHGHVRLLA